MDTSSDMFGLNDAERVLVQMACLQLGIPPVDDPFQAVRATLAKMSTEDALKARRKFRKLWKTALRHKQGNKTELNKKKIKRCVQHFPGSGPVGYELKFRRLLVLNWLLKQVRPMLVNVTPKTRF